MCLLYEGDSAIPSGYQRSDVARCDVPLASLVATAQEHNAAGVVYSQCALAGFPRRGLYRFYGAMCDDFWGNLRVGVRQPRVRYH